MDAKAQIHVARTTTFGCVRTTTASRLPHPSLSSSTWSERREPDMRGRGLQAGDAQAATLASGQSGLSAAQDLTVWAQDLLDLLDDSLAHMQAMSEPPGPLITDNPLPESASSHADSEESIPALRITEVEEGDGDSVLTISSGGPESFRAESSPIPYYIVEEEEAERAPSPCTNTTPSGTCTEMHFETSVITSTPTSGSYRGKTLYETLMNRNNAPRPRISAFSLGVSPSHYSDESSEDEKDAVCIEQIQDLDELDKMLNESKQYEMRRRIRAQIRSLRKSMPADCPPRPDESIMSISSPPARPTSMFTDGTRNDFHAGFPLKAHLFSSPSGLTIDEGYSSVTSPMSPMDCSDSSFEASSPPPSTTMGDSYINGVNLLDIEDEIELHKLLDHTEDIDDRKRVRNRLREVMALHREQREAMRNHREQERENLLRKKVADADEQKRRTLAMYDAMAKSAPAGGNKTLDVQILRTGVASNSPSQNVGGEKLDLIEEAIRDRQRACDENKKKTLAAFDKAARTAPAGSARIVDFNNVTDADIREKENTPKYTSCFQMSGGVPLAKACAPRIAPRHVEPERDLMEEAIRKRQAEADERKRRTLAAYDQAARSRPAGAPVTVYIPQTSDIDPVVVSLVSRVKDGSKSDAPIHPATPKTPNYPRPAPQQATRQQTVVKPQPQQPTSQSQMNIKTQSSVRTVNNPYQNARPAAPPPPSNVATTRTTVTTQKTVLPQQQIQQRQVTTTVTTQSTRTVQQQPQQIRQQQRYVEESEEEEEEEEELEEDY